MQTCQHTHTYYCIHALLLIIIIACPFCPVPRHSLSSSYVWRLRQTLSASSSSPSSGCFLLPAPTCGSSMSGTQVSPSFFVDSLFLLPNGYLNLSNLCTRNSKLLSLFSVRPKESIVSLFLSHFHTERGVCLPTVSLWILFVYIEAAIRFKDLKNFHVDLCRPFAAHW